MKYFAFKKFRFIRQEDIVLKASIYSMYGLMFLAIILAIREQSIVIEGYAHIDVKAQGRIPQTLI